MSCVQCLFDGTKPTGKILLYLLPGWGGVVRLCQKHKPELLEGKK